MSMTKKPKELFTPGPWHVVDTREEDDIDSDYEIADKYDWLVAVPGNDHLYIEEANAYLIAAAPDMYHLLAKMLESDRCNIAYFKISVENALKKARGEEQDEW